MASKMIMSNEVAAAVEEEEEEASGCGSRGGGLKKGPWTTSEDAILVEYVRKHGEGNWNAVQKNSGLARCGKSCRLRWANHLRPNLKKGSFSPEEERIIIELHAKIGNKWARMASQLPGRTDNEIKNYWNTRMKRRQRAGLPLYPHDIQQYQNDSPQLHSSSSSSSFSSQLLSSSHHHHLHSPKPNYTFHPHHSAFHSQPSDSNHLFNGHNGRSGFALPISTPVFTFGSPTSSTSPPPTLFNQSTHIPIPQTTLPAPSFQYNVPAGSFGYNFGTLSSMVTGVPPYDPPAPAMGLQAPSLNMVTELPSTQTTPLQSTTPVSSYTSGCGCGEDEFEFQQSRGNSGLLDALLVESQSLSHNEKTKRKASPEPAPEKAKRVMSENQLAEEEERTIGSESVMKSSGETASTGDENGRTENFSTSSVGVEQSEDPLDVNSMDDDLMSLLNNFPTSMPVPDWYGGGGKLSNLEESGITSGYARRGVEDVIAQDSSLPAPTTTTTTGKHERRSLDSCYWNNMPGIC